jgi:AraC-like DNA-binding protein
VTSVGSSEFGERVSVGRWRLLQGVWCLQAFGYEGSLKVGNVFMPIKPGYVAMIPPDTDLEFHFPGQRPPASYLHFQLPKINARPQRWIPAIQDLSDRFQAFSIAMEEAIGFHLTLPWRANIRLWELLCQLSEIHEGPAPTSTSPIGAVGGSLVERAKELIEVHLGERLEVAALARELGISHGHLSRQFKAATGSTVERYIRDQRVGRAHHLLIHTTRPIKSIAAEVGIGDPHRFNKMLRSGLGASPRKIRGR